MGLQKLGTIKKDKVVALSECIGLISSTDLSTIFSFKSKCDNFQLIYGLMDDYSVVTFWFNWRNNVSIPLEMTYKNVVHIYFNFNTRLETLTWSGIYVTCLSHYLYYKVRKIIYQPQKESNISNCKFHDFYAFHDFCNILHQF